VPTQKPNPNLTQTVPDGISIITARSFTERCAAGSDGVAEISCETCPNADPQAKPQANAPAANDLIITPPREFRLCSEWISQRNRRDNRIYSLTEED